MPPQAIRMLPFGISLVLLRAAPPIITDLRTWTSRPDADQLTADRTQVETLLQATARRARPGTDDTDQDVVPDGGATAHHLTAQVPAPDALPDVVPDAPFGAGDEGSRKGKS